jgi:O-antigen/teichoic acid export membrane protein
MHPMNSVLATLRQLKGNRLATGTAALTVGLGMRTVGQGLMFVIVARTLGVGDYGAYAATMAIAGTLGCFTGLGTATTLIRLVARDKTSFGHAWWRSIACIAYTAPPLLAIYFVLARFVLPLGVAGSAVLFIGIAEIVFAPVAQLAANAYQGHDRIARSSRLIIAPVVPRFVGALVLIPLVRLLASRQHLIAWSILYALASLLAAIYALGMVRRDLGPAVRPKRLALEVSLFQGAPFAVGGAALRVYTDIDKTMLARMASLSSAGSYAAAYRIIDMAMVPVMSLLTAMLPRFFRHGEITAQSIAYTSRIAIWPLAYVLACAAALYACSDLLPWLLGRSYQAAAQSVRWLALVPLVAMPRLFFQHVLIGADRHRTAVVTLAAGAIFNIVANLLAIPAYGWRGATIATYASELLMTAIMGVFLWRALHASRMQRKST